MEKIMESSALHVSQEAHVSHEAQDPQKSLASQCFTVRHNTPKDGVTFYSMENLLTSFKLRADVTWMIIDAIWTLRTKFVESTKITHILALESRGYFLGCWLSDLMKLPFVPVRKLVQARRLVRSDDELVISPSYVTEYGSAVYDDNARVCVMRNTIPPGSHVLIIDDVLATGGTMRAAISLAQQCGATIQACVALLLVETAFTKPLPAKALTIFTAKVDGSLHDEFRIFK